MLWQTRLVVASRPEVTVFAAPVWNLNSFQAGAPVDDVVRRNTQGGTGAPPRRPESIEKIDSNKSI
jgi:hypothetical protein